MVRGLWASLLVLICACSSPQENSGGWVETENSVAIVVIDSNGNNLKLDSLVVLVISLEEYVNSLEMNNSETSTEVNWDTLRVSSGEYLNFKSKEVSQMLFRLEIENSKEWTVVGGRELQDNQLEWQITETEKVNVTKSIINPAFSLVSLMGHNEIAQVSKSGSFSFNEIPKGSYRTLGWNGSFWQYVGVMDVLGEGADYENSLFSCVEQEALGVDFNLEFFEFPGILPVYSVLANDYGIQGAISKNDVDSVEINVSGSKTQNGFSEVMDGEFNWVLNDLQTIENIKLRFQAEGYAPACIQILKGN